MRTFALIVGFVVVNALGVAYRVVGRVAEPTSPPTVVAEQTAQPSVTEPTPPPPSATEHASPPPLDVAQDTNVIDPTPSPAAVVEPASTSPSPAEPRSARNSGAPPARPETPPPSRASVVRGRLRGAPQLARARGGPAPSARPVHESADDEARADSTARRPERASNSILQTMEPNPYKLGD